MLLAMFVLTFLVTIPNAPATVAHFEGLALLIARRAQLLGRGGPIFRVGSASSLSVLSADSPIDMDPSCSGAVVVPSSFDDDMVVLCSNFQAEYPVLQRRYAQELCTSRADVYVRIRHQVMSRVNAT